MTRAIITNDVKELIEHGFVISECPNEYAFGCTLITHDEFFIALHPTQAQTFNAINIDDARCTTIIYGKYACIVAGSWYNTNYVLPVKIGNKMAIEVIQSIQLRATAANNMIAEGHKQLVELTTEFRGMLS